MSSSISEINNTGHLYTTCRAHKNYALVHCLKLNPLQVEKKAASQLLEMSLFQISYTSHSNVSLINPARSRIIFTIYALQTIVRKLKQL
jgi:hypothetical protein